MARAKKDAEKDDKADDVEETQSGLTSDEVRTGTTPLPANPRNPGADYDDDARG